MSHSVERRAAPPGPGGLPGLDWWGNALSRLRDPVVGMLGLQTQYGDIVALGRRPDAPILTFAPAGNHLLLTNTSLFHSFDANGSGAVIAMPPDTAAARLLSGVASMNGDLHRAHRRVLMPAFHRTAVDSLRDQLVAVIESHLAAWRAGQQRDLVGEMIALSLALAVRGLLGLDPDVEGRRIHTLLQPWTTSALSLPVALLPRDWPGLPFRRFLRLSDAMETELRAVIRRKQAQDGGGSDALASLLALYAAPEDDDPTDRPITLSEPQLLGHLATLFSSGHETTASALAWTLFLLAQHPRVLADLQDELDGVLHGDAPTVAQLRDLPLLDRVINESLRLFPPGMWMLRTSTGPFTLGPYDFPAGTRIVFSPAVTHRRADLYPDPHRFLPERWEHLDPTPYEYLPFGAGSRRCLGATFAMMELRLVVPLIVQRFRLRLRDGTRVDRAGAVLSFPSRPLPVRLAPPTTRPRAARLRGNIHALLAPLA